MQPGTLGDMIKEKCRHRDRYERLSVSQAERLGEMLERKKDILPEKLVKGRAFELKYTG